MFFCKRIFFHSVGSYISLKFPKLTLWLFPFEFPICGLTGHLACANCNLRSSMAIRDVIIQGSTIHAPARDQYNLNYQVIEPVRFSFSGIRSLDKIDALIGVRSLSSSFLGCPCVE